MDKKFVLIATYTSGNKVTMLTNTPDLQQALKEFNNKLLELYSKDKGNMIPYVVKAEIVPILYENLNNNLNVQEFEETHGEMRKILEQDEITKETKWYNFTPWSNR